TPSDIQHSAATQIWGCYRLVSRAKGADEEISDGGSPRVIIYGYDGLPIQPVAPPSPDYIPGPEDPQTPPVPQDEDDEDEEEEEHLSSADSAIVVPTDEPISLPKGTEPIIPPPSTDITTTRARITFRP
ncbi:hypothetical protein Tco_0061679, partial [Tanacetum coccineum]